MNILSSHRDFYNILDRVARQNLCLPANLNPDILIFCACFGQQGCGRLKRQSFLALLSEALPWYDRVVVTLERIQILVQKVAFFQHHTPLLRSVERAIALSFSVARSVLVEALPSFSKHIQRTRTQHLMDACLNLMHYSLWMRVHLAPGEHDALRGLLALVFSEHTVEQISDTYAAAMALVQRSPLCIPAGQMGFCFESTPD